MVDSDSERVIEKWAVIAHTLLQQNLLRSWVASAKRLPEEVVALYANIEFSSGIRFEENDKQRYYDEFSQMASGFGKIQLTDVVSLVRERLGLNISREILENALQGILQLANAERPERLTSRNIEFNFEQFLAFLCQILQSPELKSELVQNERPRRVTAKLTFRHIFPLDPESGAKMAWDLFCMVLLMYCSFSVPYSLAFENSEDSEPNFDLNLAIDFLFMFDIALSFGTAFDLQGVMVKDFRAIARNYLRSWFVPDLLGSFPFDVVVTALVDVSSMGSSNLVRAFRLVRILKLVRAVKFINKLNKIKERVRASPATANHDLQALFCCYLLYLLSCCAC